VEPEQTVGARRMTTAEAVVDVLVRSGIDKIFGLPGVHNDHLMDAFYGVRDRVRFIHTRHEQSAGYMALGAAMVTGTPQVCCVVPGPGLLNASTALLTAYATNAPVLALIGQIPQAAIDCRQGHLHELRDQVGLARHFTKFAARISAPQEAPAIILDALRHAMTGPKGPVMVECAMDVWGRSGMVYPQAGLEPLLSPPVDEDAVDRAAKILAESERPLIVVGGGAQGASPEVIALAEMLEAPVLAFRRGQGVAPATHRLSVNLPIGHRLWGATDAVLGIGTRLFTQQMQWGMDNKLKVVRLNIDPEEPERVRKPEVALIGDAKAYCAALLRRLPTYARQRPSRSDELAQHRAWLAERLKKLEPQMSFLKAMRAALPPEGIFVEEITQLGFASRLAFPVLQPQTYFSPAYQDPLGWGLGTALGIKAARSDTPVLLISGDGGFLYQIGELATAVLHGIPVVAVIFDNGSYGNVRLTQRNAFGGRFIASDLANPDFVKLADAFGVASFQANTADELQHAIADAFDLNRPAVVHVPCDEMPSPWDMIHLPKIRG